MPLLPKLWHFHWRIQVLITLGFSVCNNFFGGCKLLHDIFLYNVYLFDPTSRKTALCTIRGFNYNNGVTQELWYRYDILLGPVALDIIDYYILKAL